MASVLRRFSRLTTVRPLFSSSPFNAASPRAFSLLAASAMACRSPVLAQKGFGFHRRLFSTTFSQPPKMTILYGSQTGTAMGFAHELRKAARKHSILGNKLDAKVVDLNDYDPSQMDKDGLLVFFNACFGHGEPTDNAKKFFNWLMAAEREGSASPDFKKTNFGMFGLGQSKHYPAQYQKASKDITARLEKLGAHLVFVRGEGDASGDQEDHFEQWVDGLWKYLHDLEKKNPGQLVALFSGSGAASSTTPATPAPAPTPTPSTPPTPSQPTAPATPATPAATVASCAAMPKPTTTSKPVASCSAPVTPADIRHPVKAIIALKRELHSLASMRSCSHIEFDLSDPEMSGKLHYECGDYLGVFPENDRHVVELVAKRLKLPLNMMIDLNDHPIIAQEHAKFQQEHDRTKSGVSMSVGTILTHYLDLQSIPKRSVLRGFARVAQNPVEQQKLEFLASNSPLGMSDYDFFVQRESRTLLEILQAFPSIKVSADELVELLPPLNCRYYSISSSPLVTPDRLSITVGHLVYTTTLGRRREGICSGFLSRRREGDTIPVFVKQSLFKLPQDSTKPCIMLCAGTGIAPFRGFLQQRNYLRRTGRQVGEDSLFFGCMDSRQDLLYDDEILPMSVPTTTSSATTDVSSGVAAPLRLVTAFSHEQPWRIFVQHKMIEQQNAQHIWETMDKKGGYLFVCGDARGMAAGVHEALIHIAQTQGDMSREKAEDYLKQLQAINRYQLDIF